MRRHLTGHNVIFPEPSVSLSRQLDALEVLDFLATPHSNARPSCCFGLLAWLICSAGPP